MTSIYVLLKTDPSDGASHKASCIGAYGSEAVARNKALHVLEDFANAASTTFDEDELYASTVDGEAIQLSISKIDISGVQIDGVEDIAQSVELLKAQS